ncbi:hypothetical protein B0H13DRAFT_1985529 [Mycena leptocephala]|nr:hypothetical protein B0H13DRAFT_1985529 [Mycena leptocephala]
MDTELLGPAVYAPPPPPPDTQQYNTVPPPPVRPASNEHQQRVWNHPSYARPAAPPLEYSSPPTRPATNSIDFHKLVNSYHMILEAGKTLSAPRATDGAMDRMLENAFYAAQVLDDASASSGTSHATPHQSQPRPTVVRASPVTVQQAPSIQQHPHPQLQRIHSASSGSDTSRAPNYSQPAARSPPRSSASAIPRVKEISPREAKTKIKINSPVNGKPSSGLPGRSLGGGSDGALVSSPSKPKFQKLEDSGHAPAVTDAPGAGRAQDAHHGGTQKCLGCGATSTPEWRRGPLGEDIAIAVTQSVLTQLYPGQVKKRLREDARVGGSTRAANSFGGRTTGQSHKEESPDPESDEDDEEQPYDHTHMPGR